MPQVLHPDRLSVWPVVHTQLRAMEGEEGSGGVGGRLLPQATDGYRNSGIELAQIRVNPFRLYYPGQTYTPEVRSPETKAAIPADKRRTKITTAPRKGAACWGGASSVPTQWGTALRGTG